MSVYYNEIDPKAAAWLRVLIRAKLIPAGDVDERDIRDVLPNEIINYTQCHFFAGIGGWSRALRLVGWPEDVPIWTGSCPCQPFSAADLCAASVGAPHWRQRLYFGGLADSTSERLQRWLSGWKGAQGEVVNGHTGSGGQLSPDHSRWLMGYPIEWGLVRGYGNAVVPEVAQKFIEAFIEC